MAMEMLRAIVLKGNNAEPSDRCSSSYCASWDWPDTQLLVHTLNRKGLHMGVHLDSPASRNQECDDIRFFRMHVVGSYYPSHSSGCRSDPLLPGSWQLPLFIFSRFSCQMNTVSIHHTYIHTVRPLSFSHLFSRPSRPWLSPSSLPPTAFSFLYSSCRTPWLSFL